MLRQQVEQARIEFGTEKVNVIGHSMGGLDSRFVFI